MSLVQVVATFADNALLKIIPYVTSINPQVFRHASVPVQSKSRITLNALPAIADIQTVGAHISTHGPQLVEPSQTTGTRYFRLSTVYRSLALTAL